MPNDNFQFLSGGDAQAAAKILLYRDNHERFFANELKIKTKQIGYSSLTPNKAQAPLIASVKKQLKEQGKIRQLWFKGRQIGASTLASGYIFHKTSLFSGVNSFIVAQDKVTASKIFTMADLFYKNMSREIRPPRSYFTKGTELVLGQENTDRDATGVTSNLLVGQAKEINLGIGGTIHCLHLSEIARYQSSLPLTESLFPACSDAQGTIRIIESTAYFGGGADYFREQCLRAMQGDGEYRYAFSPWWLLDEYSIPLKKHERFKLDAHSQYPNEKYLLKKVGLTLENLKWRRSKIDEYSGDIDLFHLSYPTDFEEAWITRDASAFPYGKLKDMLANVCPPMQRFMVEDGKLYRHPEGNLQVWKMPVKDKIYDIGADVAGGDGRSTDGGDSKNLDDFSTVQVVERGTLEQCAEWRGQILPRQFADVMAAIGRFYNEGQIAPEMNTFGMSTLERLRENYSNIYVWRKRDGVSMQFTKKLGWATTYESKNTMVNTMREKLYYNQAIIHSKDLWDEMRNFVKDLTPTGMITYRAATGHDDLAMAFLIAVQTSEDENLERYYKTSVSDNSVEEKKPSRDEAYFDAVGLTPVEGDSLKVDIGGWN